jgi:pilus assembly protein CpaB
MMKQLTPAKLTFLMFVAVGGLVVAYVAKKMLAVEPRPAVAAVSRMMAMVDLEPGTVISETHVGLGPVLASELDPEMLLNNRTLLGRVVRTRIPAATAIRTSQLYQPGELPPLTVEPGMRVVAVDIGESVAMVDGLIRPGQYVDVLLTPSNANGGSQDQRLNGGLTLTLFKGVKVVSINRNFAYGQPARGGNTVTLELTPQQANVMTLARQRGTVTLTYNPEGKGSGGVAVESPDRATLEEILGLRAEAPSFKAEIFRQGNRAAVEFRGGKRVESSTGDFTPPAGTAPSSTPSPPGVPTAAVTPPKH